MIVTWYLFISVYINLRKSKGRTDSCKNYIHIMKDITFSLLIYHEADGFCPRPLSVGSHRPGNPLLAWTSSWYRCSHSSLAVDMWSVLLVNEVLDKDGW